MRNNLNIYSLRERIFLVKQFYKSNCCANSVRKDYVLEFGRSDDVCPDSLIFEVVDLFEETGSVREVPKVDDHGENCVNSAPIDPWWVEVDVDVKDIKIEEPEIDLPEEMIVHPPDLIPDPEDNPVKKEFDENGEKGSEEEEDDFWEDPPVEEDSVPIQKPAKVKKKWRREGIDPKYSCHICDWKFISKSGMCRHMKTQHFTKRDSCKICGQATRSVHELRVHMKEAHNRNYYDKLEKKFACPDPTCSMKFTYDHLLRNHMIKHSTVKTEVCDICGVACKTAVTLKHHMKVHSDERNYKCDFQNCTRSFKSRSSLGLHRKTHTGEKPFPCPICGKKFSSKNAVRVHQLQHTGENPFSCELCGKTTKQKHNLLSHMKHFHKIQFPKLK